MHVQNIIMMALKDAITTRVKDQLDKEGVFIMKGASGSSISFQFRDENGKMSSYIVRLQEK
jgi:hypothetical protein